MDGTQVQNRTVQNRSLPGMDCSGCSGLHDSGQHGGCSSAPSADDVDAGSMCNRQRVVGIGFRTKPGTGSSHGCVVGSFAACSKQRSEEPPFSRILDACWAEVALSHLKEAEDYASRRSKLGRGGASTLEEKPDPKGKAKAKAKALAHSDSQ